jgi:hypothetical protein
MSWSPSEASAPKRTRERLRSKAEAKRDTSQQAVMETIKTFLDNKEVSSEKRDERKHLEKEEAVKNYIAIQPKKLALKEINTHNKHKELELSLLTEEAKLMATLLSNDMHQTQLSGLKKKKMMMMILDRDVSFTRSRYHLCPYYFELCVHRRF